jgi:hypothetical protein
MQSIKGWFGGTAVFATLPYASIRHEACPSKLTLPSQQCLLHGSLGGTTPMLLPVGSVMPRNVTFREDEHCSCQ